MAGFRGFWIALIMVAVFLIAILNFSTRFLDENNPSQNLSSDANFNVAYNNLTAELGTLQSDTENAKIEFEKSKPSKTDFLFLIFETIWSVPLNLLGNAYAIYNFVLRYMIPTVFGVEFNVVWGAIFSVLIVTGIILLIKIVRSGEGER